MIGAEQPDPQVLDLYKIAVEMADRVSARRATANSFFITVEAALVSVLAVAIPSTEDAPWWAVLAATVAGLMISLTWWLLLRSYRALNGAKFNVILQIEADYLPIRLFTDEWVTLKKDPVRGWRRRYAELGTIERMVPLIFGALYLLLFAGAIA